MLSSSTNIWLRQGKLMTDKATSDPARNLAKVCAVLESLGYTIERQTSSAPLCQAVGSHPENLAVIVTLLGHSVELSCHWGWTEEAKERPEETLSAVNEMNALSRLVCCQAGPECMTVRACYPFAFDSDRFRTFLAAWMEDGKEIIADVCQRHANWLNTEMVH